MMVLRMAGGSGVHVHPMHPTGSAPANDQWADLTTSVGRAIDCQVSSLEEVQIHFKLKSTLAGLLYMTIVLWF